MARGRRSAASLPASPLSRAGTLLHADPGLYPTGSLRQGLSPERVRGYPSPGARTMTFPRGDRKSTRLNSSHLVISYAVFCLKKKKKTHSKAEIIITQMQTQQTVQGPL